MKRINVYQGAVLRWSAYQPDDEYAAWLANCIATNIWGAVGTYTTEVLDGNAEWAEIILANEVTTKIYSDENFYKISDINGGAASTIITTNLTADKALASDASGKVAVSATTSTELGYVSGVTSAIQTQLGSKQATVTGAATTITSSDLTADRVVISNGSGKIASSSVTAPELGFVSGVTSSIQTQLDSKANNVDTELVGTINWAKNNTDPLVDISDLVALTPTMGLIEGGQLTINSGRVLNVAATIGYAVSSDSYPTHQIVRIDQASTTLTLPANADVYIYYTAGGVLSSNVTNPGSISNILLGRVVTDDFDITYIEDSEIYAHHWSNYTDIMLREAFGAIFSTGGIITENVTTPLNLDINNGTYFYSEHKLTLAGTTALSFTAYYKNGTGGYTAQSPATLVSNSLWDDGSGTLASISSGYFAKHLVLGIKQQDGTQSFLLIYADSQWSSAAQAKAAPLPATPEFVKNTFVRLASIVVEEGVSGIDTIIDERPRVGFSPSAVTSTVITNHGDLSGLANDDHLQYILGNGSRAMSGDLSLGGNDITNVLTLNGVVVDAHASRHQPGGADAIPTATAISIASANAEGSSTSLARADHAHKIDNLFITNSLLAGSIDSTKISSGLVSNTEFDYLNGVTSSIQTQISSKEATITGAATTITSADLTIDRAVVSNGSGKIGVSSATSTEVGYLSGVTSAIQTQVNSKQPSITGAATTIASSNLALNRAVISDASGKIDISATTSAEIGYVSGVTSAIQTQINDKQNTVTGGASTITSANLTASRALASDAGGKVVTSATTSAELGYVSGVTSAIQTQLGGKEPSITVGTTGQYWRGDKSFQTLDKTAVGLGSVDNTADTAKAIAGDVTGTLGASTVAKLQNRTLASTAPLTNQMIKWDGSQWLPAYSTAWTSTAVSAGTIALTASSSRGQIFTGTTGGQIVNLPDATTLVIGDTFNLINSSDPLVILRDGSSVYKTTLLPTRQITATLINNSTTAGSWSFVDTSIEFGDFNLYDDFVSANVTTNQISALGWTIATGTVAYQASTGASTGVIRVNTATANNSVGAFSLGTTLPVLINNAYTFFEARVSLPSLGGTGANQLGFHIGLQTLATVTTMAANPLSAIGFQYDGSTNTPQPFTAFASSATTTSVAASATTPTASTFYKLSFIVNTAGTTAYYYVNNTFAGAISTNMPTAIVMGPMVKVSAGGNNAAAKSVDVDYYRLQKIYTTPR